MVPMAMADEHDNRTLIEGVGIQPQLRWELGLRWVPLDVNALLGSPIFDQNSTSSPPPTTTSFLPSASSIVQLS